MQFRRYLIVIIIGFLLQGCASPKMSQELEQGKLTFQQGDYKQAFRQLLPIAAAGRPEAQYAVGYMYYYGYGVPRDAESGTFWMTKAADQNYAPAIKALALTREPNDATPTPLSMNQQEARPPNQVIQHNNDQNDPVLQSLPVRREPMKQRTISYPVYHPAYQPHEKAAYVTPSSSPYFTLQLLGSYHLSDAKSLQTHLQLKNRSAIWRTMHNGKDWYVLTTGHYATVHQAVEGRKQLPEKLRQLSPWVRKTEGLKKVSIK